MFELVIEESPASPIQTYDERTRAIIEGDEVHILYEYLEDGVWVAWGDVGAHIPIDIYMLLAGVLENRHKIVAAVAEG